MTTESSQVDSTPRRLLAFLRIVIGVGLLVYVISVTDAWQTLLRLGGSPWVMAALPIVAFIGTGVEAVRLQLLYRALKIDISFFRGCQLSAIGALYNFVIPGGTGGDVMKLYYVARENQGRIVETGLVLLVDRAVSLFGLLLLILALAIPNAELVREHSLMAWLVVAVATGATAILFAMKLSFSERLRCSRLYLLAIRSRPLGQILERAFDALYAFRDHKRDLLRALAWSISGHVCLAGMLLATGVALMPEAPARIFPFITLLGGLANVIPITPGGIGVGEAVTELFYSSVGVAGGAALILIWRCSTLPVCAVGAVFCIIGVKRRDDLPLSEEEATTTLPTE